MAGCLNLTEDDSWEQPSVLGDRGDSVYVPTHTEGMQMAGTRSVGRYRFALSYARPHRFWLVTGDRVRQVGVSESDSMHLMLTAWDGETGTVVPTSNAVVRVTQDGEVVVSDTPLWSMISQSMGLHFGDNVTLDGDGSYEVEVSFGPVETRRAGTLAGALSEQVSVTFDLEYSESAVDDLSFEEMGYRAGEPDAVEPMGMDMIPAGQAPPSDALPGDPLDEGTSGDGRFLARSLPVPEGVDGDGQYLAISAQTPYNRYPLPFMSLSTTVTRDGSAVFEGELTGTLHPDFAYHYGTVVDSLESGDQIRIVVDAPPQVARHEGYETAFVEMAPVELTV
jgi:hypothetical protein